MGRGTGGSVCPALGAVCGPRLSIANQSIILIAGSSHLLLEALWVDVVVHFGAEGPFRYGKKRGVQCERCMQEGRGLPKKGERDSGSGRKDFAGLGDDRELFSHLFILKHIH